MTPRICGHLDNIHYKQVSAVYDPLSLSPTLTTGNHGKPVKIRETDRMMMIAENTRKGYIEGNAGDGIELERPNDRSHRGRVQTQKSPTLRCSCTVGVIDHHERIRMLTPREYWRLMGFSDEDYDKASKVSSESQLYEQAGNSIVVDVLMAIFGEIYSPTQKVVKRPTLESYGGN